MHDDHSAHATFEVRGVYFELDELELLVGLSVCGVRIEISTTARAYEEIALIRQRASGVILGTLHKTSEAILVLTKENPSRLLARGSREAYLTIIEVLSAITRLATRTLASDH